MNQYQYVHWRDDIVSLLASREKSELKDKREDDGR